MGNSSSSRAPAESPSELSSGGGVAAAQEAEKQGPVEVVKRIAIVGGGAAGIAALKIVAEMPQFQSGAWQATLYERRDNVGGVWHPAPPTDNPPQTPLYDSLTTNLPHTVMAYEDFPFPPSTPLYPRAAVVQTYLETVTTHFGLTPHIRLNTAVTSIERDESGLHAWRVALSTGEAGGFDHVIIAVGHYTVPRLPATPGLAGWLASGRAHHSAWYRHPDPDPARANDTVLVIGAGPSASDITDDLRHAGRTVIRSVRGAARQDEEGGKLKSRSVVVDYRPDGSVLFDDGTVESEIDHCWVATGFQAQYPFFPASFLLKGLPPFPPPLADALYDSSHHLFPLAQHTFPLTAACAPSSLAFIGLPMYTPLMPLFSAQARAAVRVFAEPAALDPQREAAAVLARVERIVAERLGAGRQHDAQALAREYHGLFPGEGFRYRNEMNAWAAPVVRSGDRTVPDWVVWAYANKIVLRAQWRRLEKEGLAEEWVRGVGEGGTHEWVELMEKVVKRAEEQGATDGTKDEGQLHA